MSYALVSRAAQAQALDILGGFHPEPDEGQLAGCESACKIDPPGWVMSE